ncbi:unnamed protein product [Victoria cruziana]
MESPWTISPFLLLLLLTLALTLTGALAFSLFCSIRDLEWSRNNAHQTCFLDPNSREQVVSSSIFNPAEKYLSLIIPAFNEENRLPEALRETMSYLEQRATSDKSFSYEVIIVDDGSRDGTSKIALDQVKKYRIDNLRVISLGSNQGKGAAIRNGILHARGALLLMLDADGATKITDLEKLEEQISISTKKKLNSREGDHSTSSAVSFSEVSVVAFGSRAHLEKQALATRKWYRNFLMKGFHLLVLLTAGSGVRDTQCGFKMFTRAAAQKLFTNMRLRRWCFDVELVYLSERLTIPITEISVSWTEIPGSKVRMSSIIHMLFELMLIRIGYGLGFWKIHS